MADQKPYRATIHPVPDGSVDYPLIENAFGADFLSTLKGAPNNVILQFNRDISYKLVATTNDSIDALNAANSPCRIGFQDAQTIWTDTLKIPEIYITNNSGASDSIQIQVYANRLK